MKDYIDVIEREEDSIVERVSGEKLMEFTSEIAKWIRVSGTEDEVDSLVYCKNLLDSFGYTTKLSYHDAFISVPVNAFVEMESPTNRSFEAITHSFSASTKPTGLVSEVVLSTSKSVDGKIVLCNGLPSADEVNMLTKLGVLAIIYSQDEYLHNYQISPIWGGPTDLTENLIPIIPVVSVTKESGDFIKESIAKGMTNIRIESTVDTGWRKVPLLEADMLADNDDSFLLFSSHIDSWDYGAMDNGAADATLIECARLLAEKQPLWQRGLRLAFWAGHSQGKFFSSSWYSDNHFEELQEKCIGHVYVDSTGGKGADIIIEAPVMPQTRKLAADVVKKQTGQEFIGKRIGRYADQSFYGIGLTSIFGTFSEQDARKNEDVVSFKMGNTKHAGGLGWWWHTKHDTIDKVDENILVRDTKVYLGVVWRLLTQPVLPYDFNEAVKEISETVSNLQTKLEGRFDLTLLAKRVDRLCYLTEEMNRKIESITEPNDLSIKMNRKLMKLSQKIVRITFHGNNHFDFDLSGPMFPLPSLADGLKLSTCALGSYKYFSTRLKFQRGCNRVMSYIKEAIELLEE